MEPDILGYVNDKLLELYRSLANIDPDLKHSERISFKSEAEGGIIQLELLIKQFNLK